MFSKSNLISTVVTGIWGFLGGWLLWGTLADPILEEHTATAAKGLMKEMPDMFHLAIGCLLTGLFFSTIYGKYGRGGWSAGNGLTYGVLVGLLLGLGDGMVNMSVMNMLDFTGMLINAVVYVVFYAVMGLLAGLIYQKTMPTEA